MAGFYLAISMDDGTPTDIKMALLLDKYKLRGTFYVPLNNIEGNLTLKDSDIRSIGMDHEIGSHTKDHQYLNLCSLNTAVHQIQSGKDCLQQILGSEVKGFCYPGGRYNSDIKRAVVDAGFLYARTTQSFYYNNELNSFNVPTTFQFYPHSRSTYLRNYLSGSKFFQRMRVFKSLFVNKDFIKVSNELESLSRYETVLLHVWGHSHEIEQYNLWGDFETFLKRLTALNPKSISVLESRALSGEI